MSEVLERVRTLLRDADIAFRELHHEPTFTSEQSARVRGESLAIGAKALVAKADAKFLLLVIPANRKLDSTAVKRYFNAKKLRFASPLELLSLTGLQPGSVPPFGEPIIPLPVVADLALLANSQVAFNAGSLTDSIIMSSSGYQRIVGAEWTRISVE